MNYIVFDLEATCWKEEPYKKDMETIEIGAVKFNDKGEVIDVFDVYIKPTLNPILSDFCKELTHITQETVDNAKNGKEVIERFRSWVGGGWLCSWGWYDKRQLKMDCKLHGIDADWLKNHISVKHQYMEMKGLEKCGLGKAMELEGIKFSGTPHNGFDDAYNIGVIFQKYFDKWIFK
jgi:inhibitor of KinA sporulation pathway (predicted exonuclease)